MSTTPRAACTNMIFVVRLGDRGIDPLGRRADAS